MLLSASAWNHRSRLADPLSFVLVLGYFPHYSQRVCFGFLFCSFFKTQRHVVMSSLYYALQCSPVSLRIDFAVRNLAYKEGPHPFSICIFSLDDLIHSNSFK